MTTTNTEQWRFQNEDGEVSSGSPTDARGLNLRQECGYTHVYMGWRAGWLQIRVAIRKLALAEQLAAVRPGGKA